MKFVIARDALLKPLNLVAGVVERRQTLPILSNVLFELKDGELSLTGTDLEVELIGRVTLAGDASAQGSATLPARKLADICKSLPENSELEFTLGEGKAMVRSGRSRFSLSTLPAADFPSVEESEKLQSFTLKQGELARLLEKTAFAMAQQDVRYYLNGMLWEVTGSSLRLVATDGHRLAMCTLERAMEVEQSAQVILPRKGVLELARLLTDEDAPIAITVGSNHLRAATETMTFTSKLIDGKFPDYERVLPRASNRNVLADRGTLRQALSRAAILSNEKYRGIRLNLDDGQLQIMANNPEQEEAEEVVSVDYTGGSLEIGFNVSYLIDVLGALEGDTVRLALSDANSSALLGEAEGGDALYVVMPMRL